MRFLSRLLRMVTVCRLSILPASCAQPSFSLANCGVRRQRRRPVLGLAAALVTAASVAVGPAASASTPPGDGGAFSTARSTSEDHSDWLALVNGSTPIWQLSIPGSHDSYTGQASLPGGETTQTMRVLEQLKMGVRALDLRLNDCVKDKGAGCPGDGSDFWVQHGGYGLGITLSGVLTELQTFLAAHPGEFVIVRAKVENTGPTNTFPDRWNKILDSYSGILWAGTQEKGAFADPTLDEVAEKSS